VIEGGIYYWAVPLGRSIAGFMAGLMLGIVGGWMAVVIYAMAGFPWAIEVQRNMYLVLIGLGAGIGGYLGWMNLTSRRSLIIAFVVLVIIGGIAGAYLGFIYGQRVDPGFLGRRYTLDSAIHFGAAIGAIVTATALGLINQWGRSGR
jgi:hypothetical protein